MKKSIYLFLFVFFLPRALLADCDPSIAGRRGEAAGYATRDATTLSMMGWGLGIAVGIATLSTLIENNESSDSSSSSSSTTHSHS